MKKSRFSVMAVLAILFAMSSAFAVKGKAEMEKRQTTTYYWFDASTNSYHTSNTTPSEQSLTGCMYSSVDCEKGYLSSQLKNPAQPSLGVKSGEVPKAIIRRN